MKGKAYASCMSSCLFCGRETGQWK